MRQVLHARIQAEAQEDVAREAWRRDESHQWALGATDDDVAEMPPIDLRLIAGQRAQAKIGLGRLARAQAGDDVAEVAGAAAVAALLRHAVQTAGGQRRELSQRIAKERQIGIDLRASLRRPRTRHARLPEHPLDRLMVKAQLLGDRPDAPLLNVMKAQDLRFKLSRNRHAEALLAGSKDRGGAESRDGQNPGSAGRRTGNAHAAGQPREPAPSPRPPGPRPRQHPQGPQVNRDASLYFCRRASAGSGQPG